MKSLECVWKIRMHLSLVFPLPLFLGMQFLHHFSMTSPTLTLVKNSFCFSNPNKVEIQTWTYPRDFIVTQPLITKKDPKYSRYTHITPL